MIPTMNVEQLLPLLLPVVAEFGKKALDTALDSGAQAVGEGAVN